MLWVASSQDEVPAEKRHIAKAQPVAKAHSIDCGRAGAISEGRIVVAIDQYDRICGEIGPISSASSAHI